MSGDCNRHCARCGVIIRQAIGFVLGRDMLRLIGGEKIRPRELCARCILAWGSWQDPDGALRDTSREERERFIAALPAALPL